MTKVSTSISTLGRLTEGQKSFFQSLVDSAVRLAENEDLILVEKVFSNPVKEV
jgi:hypothetical protein